ncbi:hypothetical protein BKH42_04105 [Helicobacter sp. 13S00482-2]|uniref:hypothetical protein n=1 Tax=Helicobacter sp. 13S00482-2 TaxID=1476200 RepID=UPI000BA7515A|nr:hypothetical protein [Helicobacter sp. 13S00482-2]PAF53688.1 hypothetical protein BKH42_04105 [Helicobacter sp. 13S00482-2]
MLSELIKDFIDKSENLQQNIDALMELKEQIKQSLQEENLKDKIDSTPYLHSSSFYEQVASSLPLETLVQKIPQEKLQNTLIEVINNLYSPEVLAEAIFSNQDFKEAFHNRLSIETKRAITREIILKEFQKALKEQITELTKEALKENKIDKYRLESALSLFIIRIHTKLIFMQDFYDEIFKRNILKRI